MDSQPVATDPTSPRRIHWRGIRLLFLVTTCLFLLGVAGAGVVHAINVNGSGATVIVTKYASPADGTEFGFECEGDLCIEPSFDLSHTYSAVVAGFIEVPELITVTERLSPAQIEAGWRIYRIECTEPPPLPAVAQAQNGVSGPVITIEGGVTGTIVIPVDYSTRDFPYECDFYNAIPGTITIEKVEVPPVGTDYNFRMISVTIPTFKQPLFLDFIGAAQATASSLAASSTFTLDDAVPDDNDGIVKTAVFTGLFPGSYSFLEVNDANLQGIACSVNGQPAQFDKALLDILLPIDSGPVEPFSQGFNSIATNCGGNIGSGEGDRGFAYEYDLDDAPPDFASVFFRFGLNSSPWSSTPLTVEVYGYAGDGMVDDTDFGAGSLLATVQVSGTESFELDVTDLISDLLGASEDYAGFNFVVPPDQDDPYGTVLCTPYLLFRSAKGVEIPLQGAQDVHCTFTNTAPGGRIVVDKVLTGTVEGLGGQSFAFNINGPTSANFSLSADAAPYMSGLLAPGVYTLTESVPSNWSSPVYACSDGANSYPATAIAIVAGRTVTCTVTNQPLPISISLVKTVRAFTGTPTCASAGSITVVPNTVVEFCYKVTNTGQYTLGLHTLDDSVLGNILDGVKLDLAPGATVDTVALGKVVTQTVTVSVTNIATWTAEIVLDAPTVAQLQTRATSVTAASVVVQEDPSSLGEVSQPVGDRRVYVPTLQR